MAGNSVAAVVDGIAFADADLAVADDAFAAVDVAFVAVDVAFVAVDAAAFVVVAFAAVVVYAVGGAETAEFAVVEELVDGFSEGVEDLSQKDLEDQ
jgi:hypothetical protein